MKEVSIIGVDLAKQLEQNKSRIFRHLFRLLGDRSQAAR